MAVTPKGIVTPDASSPYNLVTDLNTMALTTDAAITNASNVLKGTASQRGAALSGSPAGTLWQDTDGIKMIWRKDGAAWVPAVWRWVGTTTQMNAFTQAPNGFEWLSTTDNLEYIKSGATWVPSKRSWSGAATVAQNTTGSTSITFPAGMFSTPPIVTAIVRTFKPNVGVAVLSNPTTTGAVVSTYNVTSGANINGVAFDWVATGV